MFSKLKLVDFFKQVNSNNKNYNSYNHENNKNNENPNRRHLKKIDRSN